MAQTNHYAILLTINRYPGLSDLQGPEADGLAFKAWLEDPAGGDVDPANIRHIRSSEFPVPADVYDANPTERELKRTLDGWVLTPDKEWKTQQVGQRLYLYFAGHGFTAGATISDPALFTAVAQSRDTAHIAGYRYAAKIANAGFFAEIVLVMDCCQDVLRASSVLDPTWIAPDLNQSSNVKLFQAFGAPRGRKAYERDLKGDGSVRGLFSLVWLEALNTAQADEEGWVTGQAVKNRIRQIWGERFRAETLYDPPVRLPDGDDIRLLRRQPPAAMAAVAPPARMPVDEAQAVVEPTRMSRRLPVGISNRGPAAEIAVFDAQFNKVGRGAGRVALTLPPGRYRAQAKAASATTEQVFEVLDQPMAVEVEPPAFVSAAPVAGSATTHEYQSYPALDVAQGPVDEALPGALGELFVQVRDPHHQAGREMARPLPWQQLTVRSLAETDQNRAWVRGMCRQVEDGGWASLKLGLPPGAHAVVLPHGPPGGPRSWHWLAAPVIAGWRTEIFLTCVDDPDREAGLVVDLSTASVHLVKMGQPSLLMDGAGAATELARIGLASARQARVPQPAEVERSPMLGLLSAYAAYGRDPQDTATIQQCLSGMPGEVRSALPDAVMLDRWCRQPHQGDELLRADDDDIPLRIPLLDEAWRVSMHLPCALRLDPQWRGLIGQWRLGGELWTHWRWPIDNLPALLAAQAPSASTTKALDPVWSEVAWQAAAAGLRRLDPTHSPFQQALRRRVLDMLEDGWLGPESYEAMRAEFGLDKAWAAQAYTSLYRDALRGS